MDVLSVVCCIATLTFGEAEDVPIRTEAVAVVNLPTVFKADAECNRRITEPAKDFHKAAQRFHQKLKKVEGRLRGETRDDKRKELEQRRDSLRIELDASEKNCVAKEMEIYLAWRHEVERAIASVAERRGITLVLSVGSTRDPSSIPPKRLLEAKSLRPTVAFMSDVPRLDITEDVISELAKRHSNGKE